MNLELLESIAVIIFLVGGLLAAVLTAYHLTHLGRGDD